MGKFFLLSAAWNRGCNWLVVIGAALISYSEHIKSSLPASKVETAVHATLEG